MPHSATDNLLSLQSQVLREKTVEFSLYVVMQLEKQREREKSILACGFWEPEVSHKSVIHLTLLPPQQS